MSGPTLQKQAFPRTAVQACYINSLLCSDHAQSQRVISVPTSSLLSLICWKPNPSILPLNNSCIQPLLSILSPLWSRPVSLLTWIPAETPIYFPAYALLHLPQGFLWWRTCCLHLTALSLLGTASQTLFSCAQVLRLISQDSPFCTLCSSQTEWLYMILRRHHAFLPLALCTEYLPCVPGTFSTFARVKKHISFSA